MSERGPPSSAEVGPPGNAIPFRRQIAAKIRLAQLDRYEPVAQRLDAALNINPHEIPSTVLFWQDRLAAEYRRLLGVDFTQRHTLRRELMSLLGSSD